MTNDFDLASLRAFHLYDGLEEAYCPGELSIPGPVGDLQAVVACPASRRDGIPVAVICHPHPLYGGSMANKVVHILSETFLEMGLITVRFNFRGVEESDGRFDHGSGETHDLLAVLDWVRAVYPGSPVWLAGFSFGAYVALRAHADAGVQRLLLVAPPVTMFDFKDLPPVKVPWLVVQGGRDEVIAPYAVSEWVYRQAKRPQYLWMADADHFFHGRLGRLRDAVKQAWGQAIAPKRMAG